MRPFAEAGRSHRVSPTFLPRGVPYVIDSERFPHPETPPVPITQLVPRTVSLACLCLAVLGGNSAKATLLPPEHLGAFARNGGASHGALLPDFLVHDHFPSWDPEGPSTPGIEFNLLEWSPTVDLSQTVTKVPEVSAWSELRFVAPPLANDQERLKATYLASQILANKMAPRGITRLTGELSNFRQSFGITAKRAVSWTTRLEYFAYSSLALFALGAIGLTAFRWNQDRLRKQEFDAFFNVADSDLMMARRSQAPPPDSWTERESWNSSPPRTNGRSPSIN